jgi:hypothetical protein
MRCKAGTVGVCLAAIVLVCASVFQGSPQGSSPFAGKWNGSWVNSLGERGDDSLVLAEDASGNLSGLWSGDVPVTGRRTTASTAELRGRTSTRSYQITLTASGGTLTLRYVATRLNAPGSYEGQASFRSAGNPLRPPGTVFNNFNTDGVANRPTAPTVFAIRQPYTIASVLTYHWNGGRGQPGGTIGLRSSDGRVYGPWRVTAKPGQGGAPNVQWIAEPNVSIPPGTYTVIDSDVATWSQNVRSGGQGFAEIHGEPGPVPDTPTPTVISTQDTGSSSGSGAANSQSTGESGGSEDIREARQAAIGPSGGSIRLSDGATVSVRPGVVSGQSRLVFKKIGKDAHFAATGVLAYDLSADRYPAEVLLAFPVPKGLPRASVQVFNYDPALRNDNTGVRPPFAYDAAAGTVTVTTRAARAAVPAAAAPLIRLAAYYEPPQAAPQAPDSRWLVAYATLSGPYGNPQAPIPTAPAPATVILPYYLQQGLTCYAADLKMMQRAYRPDARQELSDFIRLVGQTPKTGPSGLRFWLNSLPSSVGSALRVATGQSVESSFYFSTGNALANLAYLLRNGTPVIVARRESPDKQGDREPHSIIVAGYRAQAGNPDPASFQWLVEDTRGGTPHLNWTDSNYVTKDDYVFELWPIQPPASNRPLQTVGLPISGGETFKDTTGLMAFYITPPPDSGQALVAALGFDIGSAKGYAWVNPFPPPRTSANLSAIPAKGNRLSMKLPVWNADLLRSATVTLEFNVWPRDKKGKGAVERQRFTLSSGQTKFVEQDFPVASFVSDAGPAYTLSVNLLDSGGKLLDGFALDFVYTVDFQLTSTLNWDTQTAALKVAGPIPPGARFDWTFGDGKQQTTNTPEVTHPYAFNKSPTGTTFAGASFDVSVQIRDAKGNLVSAPKTKVLFDASPTGIKTVSSQPLPGAVVVRPEDIKKK